MRKRSAFFSVLFLCSVVLAANWTDTPTKASSNTKAPLTCKVKRIVDGDTAVFSCPGWRKPRHTRIIGYNAPDRCQPKYNEATRWLDKKLHSGKITLHFKGYDKYRRVLAKVFVDDNRIKAPKHLRAPRKRCD